MVDYLFDCDPLKMIPVQAFLDQIDKQWVKVSGKEDFFVLYCVEDVFDVVWSIFALTSGE